MTTTKLGACRRCITPTPAVTIERFTFGASAYNLELCNGHADMFRTDMFKWARVGVLDEDMPMVTTSTNDRQRGTVMKAHVAIPAARVSAEPEPVAAEVVQLASHRPLVTAEAVQALGIGAGWETWRFTEHALERREARSVSPIEALWTAHEPDATWPGKSPGTEVRQKGHVRVVVDPCCKNIITVINNDIVDQQEELQVAELDKELARAASY